MGLYRILRSPDAGQEGGALPDDIVTISRAELDALRARAGASGTAEDGPEAVPPPRLTTPPSPSPDDTATGGEVRESRPPLDPAARDLESFYAREIGAREQKVAELQRAYRDAVRDRELATALAGKPLVPGAASQLIKLWRDDFDAFEEAGEHRVCSRDGRTIHQVVAERLSSQEYAHFCLPSSRGGAGAQDANRTAKSSPPGAPRNLGEAVVMQWREQSAARANVPSRPVGLGRRRSI